MALDDEERRLLRRELQLTAAIAVVTVVVSIAGIVAQYLVAKSTIDNTRVQFNQQFDADYYDNILDRLSSSSSAVQISAMRRLTQYVLNPSNFKNGTQEDEIVNTVQAFQAFVQEQAKRTTDGLQPWKAGVPDVVYRALGYGLKRLLEHRDYYVDLSGIDVHGASLPKIHFDNDVLVSIDLRRATLSDASFRVATLRRSFLTCANLAGSDLTGADLEYADLTGANLSGADLTNAKNLTPQQIQAVRYDSRTKWPDTITSPPPQQPMSLEQCVRHINGMKKTLPGQGYDPALPEAPATNPPRPSR